MIYTPRALKSIITMLKGERRARLHDRYFDITIALDQGAREVLIKHYEKKLQELEAKESVE